MNLSTALRNIHADPFWWRKVLLGGALNLSIIGAPWSAGLVAESLENIRKGFPTPLPPSINPGARYVIGFLALIIDFFFFLLPLIIIGLLASCVLVAITFGQPTAATEPAPFLGIIGTFVVLYEAVMFAIGVAPVGRLLYVDQSAIDRALSVDVIRVALSRERRPTYGRARLLSLPAYVPLVLLAAAAWASTWLAFPGSWLVTLLLGWLALSALLYAHLVVVQLYGAAERSLG